MKQILQQLSTGKTQLENVPCPSLRAGHVLIRTTASLISSGTERMLVDFGRASLLEKARQQPDKVAATVDKIRADGLLATVEAIRHRLDQPRAMGYCNVGQILEVGEDVAGLAVGDRVASNGGHAEVVAVPKHLCARVPDGVSDEAAAFTVVGAIALQGMRLAAPTLGESVVVLGLGLIGLLAVQLLRAQGCRVLGADVDPARIALAQRFGAQAVDIRSALGTALAFSRGRGVDAVLIAASTTSNELVHLAATICRKRGRIVLTGVAGLELSRADFYAKELTFQVSCSYGPGRYDPHYEQGGHDYPIGFVRWTEQRNFEAVLDLLAEGRLDVAPLVSHRFPLHAASDAYAVLTENRSSLGIVLRYPDEREKSTLELRSAVIRRVRASAARAPRAIAVVGVIGAGSHATRVLIPALARTAVRLKSVASQDGISASHAAQKHGFEQSTTDIRSILNDREIDAVIVATRHDSHARYVCAALSAGKHVFVEKPLAVRRHELAAIEAAVAATKMSNGPRLMVGFNRRFAPHVREAKRLLAATSVPKAFVMTVNAGAIGAEHWTQDRSLGGGRIVGEACHFIDLLRFLAGAPIVSVQATGLDGTGAGALARDIATLELRFADGSIGTVHYLGNGHRSFPKERLEIFCSGRVLQLDNFRRLRSYGWTDARADFLWRQDKGHRQCIGAFVEAIRAGKASPIPFDQLIEVAHAAFDADDQLAARA